MSVGRIRVVMFPGTGNKNENRYIDVLVASLREHGVDVASWNKSFSLQRANIFHVHWPQVIADIRDRRFQLFRGHWIAWQFFWTIRRIKREGGRVVWTVHDLVPHAPSRRGPSFVDALMVRFMATVDLVLTLTQAGEGDIRRAMPILKDVPIALARHPHYRGVLGSGRYDRELRSKFGINPGQTAFAFIGSLRANKRPDVVARAFRELNKDDTFLIMAGAASEKMVTSINSVVGSLHNVSLDFRRIPEDKIIDLYSVSDVLVFPGTDYFNSGTVYTSLSLGVPVIAAWSLPNLEIQQLVGERWLYLYRGEFSWETLDAASQVLMDRRLGMQCDLSAFSPEVCAKQHIAAYRSILM
jgi:beta-1,4-mannosyltransferase